MMASQQTKLHDPMYNFDTHFPERLSRLHVHGDLTASGSFRRKKGRNQRSGARYKTQPVTFDEIKEVDEEPSAGTAGTSSGSGSKVAATKVTTTEHVLGQLQAFSRSMDGLVPKSAVFPEHLPFHISHSRSGSRKFQRHPDCIPEKSETEPMSPETGVPKKGFPFPVTSTESRRTESDNLEAATAKKRAVGSSQTGVHDQVSLPTIGATMATSHGDASVSGKPLITPGNVVPRRQKITAKAKKRQKAQGDSDTPTKV